MAEAKPGRPFSFAAAGRTDVGRQRKHNEDHVLVRPALGLWVVADGMGGHNAGDVASALTTTSLDNYFRATDPAGPFPGELPSDAPLLPAARRLAAAIRKANRDVFEISTTHQKHHGMGSTVVCAHVSLETGHMHVAHVGDSRCYRIRGHEIELLTRDHSLVNDALELKPDLTEEEVSRLPKNIITRALGMKDLVKVDVRSEPLRGGDLFLLCSDGLSGMLSDEQIVEAIQVSESLKDICDVLVSLANEAGGIDNITAVLIRIEQDPEPARAEPAPAPLAEPAPASAGGFLAPPGPPDEASFGQKLSIRAPSPLRPEELPEPAVAMDPEQTITSTPLVVNIARCGTCGSELMVGSLFCVDCGEPVG